MTELQALYLNYALIVVVCMIPIVWLIREWIKDWMKNKNKN
jgi:hypothetical protein